MLFNNLSFRFPFAVGGGDTTPPTCTITSASAYLTPGAFTCTFTFSENVTGFAVGDITVGNGSAGTFATVDAKTYTAVITPTAMGTVTVDVGANVCQDAAGNNNTAATQFSIVNVTMVAWHKADALSLNDGDDVTSWTDSGPNAYHATRRSTDGLPNFKTNIKNGLPVVRFTSSTSDNLALAAAGAKAAWKNKDYGAIFVVFKPTSATVKGDVVFIETGTGVGRFGLAVSETGYTGAFTLFGRRLDADAAQFVSGGTISANNWYVGTILVEWANAIAHLRINGAGVAESHTFQSAGNTSNTSSWSVVIASSAGASYMDGDVAEVVWCNVQVTEALAATIEAALNSKWSVYAPGLMAERPPDVGFWINVKDWFARAARYVGVEIS